MARIEGVSQLSNKLKDLRVKSERGDQTTVIVGYTAAYAVYVHENVAMKWKGRPRRSKIGVYWGPSGQAKFLEKPFRLLIHDLYRLIERTVRKGGRMLEGLTIAGLRLQKESQKIVPVEYGNLRASAFTEEEVL